MSSTKGIPNRWARFLRFSSSSSTGVLFVAAPAVVGVVSAGVGTASEALTKYIYDYFTLRGRINILVLLLLSMEVSPP